MKDHSLTSRLYVSGIQRAADSFSASVKDVSIDHGGAYVFMAEEFLHSADIVAVFEQVGDEGVPKSVATGILGNSGLADSLLDGILKVVFKEVMTADHAGTRVQI